MLALRSFALDLTLALPLTLLGCVSLESSTSGPVGCPPSEIKITSKETNFLGQAQTWTAECHGQTFYCSAQGGGQNNTPIAVCTEAAEQASKSQAAPSASGCQNDTQCKGERVCRAGACVDP